jgi:hypothetical protein
VFSNSNSNSNSNKIANKLEGVDILHIDKNAIAKGIYDSIATNANTSSGNGNGDSTHRLDVLLDYVDNVKSEKIKKVSDTITMYSGRCTFYKKWRFYRKLIALFHISNRGQLAYYIR